MAARGRTHMAVAGTALACLLALGACSGGDEGEKARTATATGTVTEVIGGEYRTRTGEDDGSYRFVVSFEDEDHVEHSAQAGNLEHERRWSEGDAVLVRYDVRDPEGSCTIEYVTPKGDGSGSTGDANAPGGGNDTGTDATDASKDARGAEADPDDNPISQLVREKTDPTGGSR